MLAVVVPEFVLLFPLEDVVVVVPPPLEHPAVTAASPALVPMRNRLRVEAFRVMCQYATLGSLEDNIITDKPSP